MRDDAKQIIDLARHWDQALSFHTRMKVIPIYPARDIKNPPYCEVPEALKDMPWNIDQAKLLAKAQDAMVFKHEQAGLKRRSYLIQKEFDKKGKPIGFTGMPENGLKGPGVIGKGMYDGLPSPVARSGDLIMFSQDPKKGDISVFLGTRPQYCFPGGFIDEGESPVYAVIREFFEEVLMASYDLGDEANAFIDNRKWEDLTQPEKKKLCQILGVPEKLAKEPYISEFKYKVLENNNPKAVSAITKYLRKAVTESYAGFNLSDPRNCGRMIYTQAFSVVHDMDKFTDLLQQNGLSLTGKSDEIGAPRMVTLSPEILVEAYNGSQGLGMYASHGPILLYALAHQIDMGHIDPKFGRAYKQIAKISEAVAADCVPKEALKKKVQKAIKRMHFR